ncbi:hypothetical protein NBRC10513_001543 [Rhodotorula toruloides]
MASALNKMTARSFRERGRRREMVQELVDDLERLFLQAKIVEDEAKRRAFVGCFLEFPGLVKRLAAKESFLSAVEEALVWEGEMVLKERRVRTESMNTMLGAGWAEASTRGGGEAVGAADNAADRPAQPHAHPLCDTPFPTTRIPTPPFVAEATSTPRPSTSASSLRPAEMDQQAEEADFASFTAHPYPARPSPTSFIFPKRPIERPLAGREGRRSSSGLWLNSGEGEPGASPAGVGRSTAPPDGGTFARPASSIASYTVDKTSTTGRGSGLIGFLRRGLGGHKRSKSYSGGPVGLASSGESVAVEQGSEGKPAKQRGKVVLGGLGLPP